ncbi:MAG: N-acetyltransferase [Saprospirales bacterium]|nr:MAG: N-acetyltransferase [Saprospirales bacterium]
MKIQIREIKEYKLDPEMAAKIAYLLQGSFSGYPRGKHFLHQLPSFRLLAESKDTLEGHVAIHHRIISCGEMIYNIFGISDLCVTEKSRKTGIATDLMTKLEQMAVEAQIDFLVLVTNVHEFYAKNGFERAENVCRWVMVQNNKSLGLVRRRVEDGLMYKKLSDLDWPNGELDLMGHIF